MIVRGHEGLMLFVVVEGGKGRITTTVFWCHWTSLDMMSNDLHDLVLVWPMYNVSWCSLSLLTFLARSRGLRGTLLWGPIEAVTYAAKDRASHESKSK
mgnify:CR=1 FL=1